MTERRRALEGIRICDFTGQLAGALYGASSIPAEFTSRLAWRDRIVELAARLSSS